MLDESNFVPMVRILYTLAFSLILAALPYPNLLAQSLPIDTIPVIDMRGMNSIDVSIAAIKNSRNAVVVLMVRGGNDELFAKAKAQMNALAKQGYSRIGIIRSSLTEGEVGPVLFIGADGTTYAAIKRAEPSTEHMWQLYRLVKDAYEEKVLPKIRAAGGR